MGLLRVYLEYGVNIKTNTVHIQRARLWSVPHPPRARKRDFHCAKQRSPANQEYQQQRNRQPAPGLIIGFRVIWGFSRGRWDHIGIKEKKMEAAI